MFSFDFKGKISVFSLNSLEKGYMQVGLLYRGPSIQEDSEGKTFFKNKDRDEMNNLNRGPSMDASFQLSLHLAKRFMRRKL
jgi:hypothetical protein